MNSINKLAIELVDEARWAGEMSNEEADYILNYIQAS